MPITIPTRLITLSLIPEPDGKFNHIKIDDEGCVIAIGRNVERPERCDEKLCTTLLNPPAFISSPRAPKR